MISPSIQKRPWNAGRKLPPEPLTRDEVEALLQACSNQAPTGVRNRALIVLLWRAGLRVGESLALRPKDLDHVAGTVHILHGKGNKNRVVGLDPQAWAVVQRWIDTRARLKINGHCRLFCTLQGKPMQQSYVRALLPRLGRKANVQKRCHAHGLRHTHASELRRENVDIGVISKQLGHASISMTAKYLDHLCPRVVIDTMRGRRWGA